MNMVQCLESLKDAVLNNKETVQRQYGICHYVHMNMYKTNLNYNEMMEKAFAKLGHHYLYPVERELYKTYNENVLHACFHNEIDKFDLSTEHGKIRMQLLDELIAYFNTVN